MPQPMNKAEPVDALTLREVTLSYAGEPVVHAVTLALKPRELGCLLGPSGCGKSTLLRAIAGFQSLNAGEIVLAGETLSTPDTVVLPERRGVGMVFQDVALFPHLTVSDNIAFGLTAWSKAEAQARITELLALIGLQGLGARYPHELSGGQQQRVALARAMAPKPNLLLLDEPFSGLDTELRGRLASEVR
ncbi:MAG: ABC transporter ATP-binding protein, partial [Gammaproteobacteria bacterium]|nr:ABC transporter ATP-binding protein [Gammaproteobacteria bacterium]